MSGYLDGLQRETIWFSQTLFEQMESDAQIAIAQMESDAQIAIAQSDVQVKESGYLDGMLRENIWFSQTQYEQMELDAQIGSARSDPVEKFQVFQKSTAKVAKKGPSPFNYEELLNKMLSDLEVKHSAVKEHVDDLQMHRQKKIEQMNQSLLVLSDVVEKCVKRFGEEVSSCDNHITSIQGLLTSLHSTMKTVQEESEMIKANKMMSTTNTPGYFSYKSLYNSFSAIINSWTEWFEDVGKLKVGSTHKVSRIVETVRQLELVENNENMNGYKKKYPKVHTSLTRFRKSLQSKKDAAATKASQSTDSQPKDKGAKPKSSDKEAGTNLTAKNDKKKKHVTSSIIVNEDNEDCDSLDGSLGSECDSKECVMVTRRAESNSVRSSASVKSGSDSLKSKPQSLGAKPKKKDSQAIPPSHHLTNPGGVRVKPDQSKKKPNSPPLSQSKSLKQEPSKTTKAVANRKQEQKYLPDRKPVVQKSSGSNHQNGMETSGACACCHSLPGATSKDYHQCHQTSFLTERQFPDFTHYKDHAKLMLMDIIQKIEHMSLARGATVQLAEMSKEADTLLKMIYHDSVSKKFENRFSSLLVAFDHQSKMYGNTSAIASGDQSSHSVTKTKGVKSSPAKSPGSSSSNRKDESKKTQTQPKNLIVAETNGKANAAMNTLRAGMLFPNSSSKVYKISSLNPCTKRDKHRAGISSLVVLDDLSYLVVVDIINGCIKLYDVNRIHAGHSGSFVCSLMVQHPYYMTAFGNNQVLVSCAQNLLVVVEVSRSKNPLILKECIQCELQFYGLGWIHGPIVACAVYENNKIDLVKIDNGFCEHFATVSSDCMGPELLSVMPELNYIVCLERVPGVGMHLVCISCQGGERIFRQSLGGKDSDVWNLACIEGKIVCCNKQTNKIILFSNRGQRLATLPMPQGDVKMPFAMGFSRFGHLYLANDAAWEKDNNHYVTTEINCFTFSA